MSDKIVAMLEKLARNVEDDSKRALGCVVVVLNEDGEWAAMMTGVNAFAACSMLEYAKTDLVVGGNHWSVFEEAAKPDLKVIQ